MDTILNLLFSGFNNIAPFFILLGLLIFVHELGHFGVAKLCGIRVETFSLGFGKKILKFKKGDTTYCLSLIPLGGYVKMFGDDPTKDVSDEEKKYAFLHKSLPQRFAVVLAGPLMNLFFAVLLYFLIATMGQLVPSSHLGDIFPMTAAHDAGFRSGDKILKVNNQDVTLWSQVKNIIEDSADKNLKFLVQRENESVEIAVTPKLSKNEMIFSTKTLIGKIEGLSNTSKGSVFGINNQVGLFAKASLPTLSIIEKINDIEIANYRQAIEVLGESTSSKTLDIQYQDFIDENAKSKSISLTLPEIWDSASRDKKLKILGVEETSLYLAKVVKDSPAQAAGLLSGDKIVAIDGQTIESWESVLDKVKSSDGKSLVFTMNRSGEEKQFSIMPKMTEIPTAQGQMDKRFTIGIVPALTQSQPTLTTQKSDGFFSALSYGWNKSLEVSGMVAMSFVRLVQGEVSPKNLSGVITIGVVATKSFKAGITTFINMMAIISINLFLLNLLPVPVLDGGHLVFFTIEALKGTPLSLRKMEIAQQVGLVLLLSLMVFALFNDFNNLFRGQW